MIPRPVVDTLADLTVPGAISLAVGLFAASLVPWYLLVGIDYGQAWRAACEYAARLLAPSREACRDAAALLLLLCTAPKGAQL